MIAYAGIDLGSTTTKAVLLDERGRMLGRGITNSRSNYDVACAVARTEALVDARFRMLGEALRAALPGGEGEEAAAGTAGATLARLERGFRLEQHRRHLARLGEVARGEVESPRHAAHRDALARAVAEILADMEREAQRLHLMAAARKSDFFRDLAQSHWQKAAEAAARRGGPGFELLMGVFDKCILVVENEAAPLELAGTVERALGAGAARRAGAGERRELERRLVETTERPIEERRTIGTGYGRQRLPFPKDCIRSEILCHGLGAHRLFPGTATVLDIGGQDTKAIQLDADGIVTSFQMNDRCAAGCGRYLGYIADEMSLGLHELGPLALEAKSAVRINSTCTVFAGAELRDRLLLGERREDILAGLHRAIVLRAMALLARSGGIRDEFTFTGGVARNPAAVRALERLVRENYGARTLNISPDSIYTGAIGAALFALRDDGRREEAAA